MCVFIVKNSQDFNAIHSVLYKFCLKNILFLYKNLSFLIHHTSICYLLLLYQRIKLLDKTTVLASKVY
nr:MAG TPA: hypothetical protein [Bacteriophage sp.]